MKNNNLSENAKRVLEMFDSNHILRKTLVNKCRENGMSRSEYSKAINELKENDIITSYEVLPSMNPAIYNIVPTDYAVTLYIVNK